MAESFVNTFKRDYVSRALAAEILKDSEEHIDFLETEIGLIEKVGPAGELLGE